MSPLLQLIAVFLHCLSLTILLELGLAFLLGVRSKGDFLLLFLAQVLTNPAVVLLSSLAEGFLTRPLYLLTVALAELGAVAAEALVYRNGLDYQRLSPLMLSFLLNLFSFGAGELMALIRQ